MLTREQVARLRRFLLRYPRATSQLFAMMSDFSDEESKTSDIVLRMADMNITRLAGYELSALKDLLDVIPPYPRDIQTHEECILVFPQVIITALCPLFAISFEHSYMAFDDLDLIQKPDNPYWCVWTLNEKTRDRPIMECRAEMRAEGKIPMSAREGIFAYIQNPSIVQASRSALYLARSVLQTKRDEVACLFDVGNGVTLGSALDDSALNWFYTPSCRIITRS